MSAVNEWVVREYFEQLGFLVTQPRKYVPAGRQKKADEEVDLVVFNPTVVEHKVPEHLIWTTEDLKQVARAVVGVRGWHTERFYASTVEQTPDITRFAEPEPIRFAAKLLNSPDMAKILCLPDLPASGELKQKTIHALKQKGIDGVISFRIMLTDLVAGVGVNRNYEKSDLLQVIRLLKNYDLLKDSQMDFFSRRNRAKPRSARKESRAAAEAPPSPAS
jgi:hypothetical protein